jgi:hypothetical protein
MGILNHFVSRLLKRYWTELDHHGQNKVATIGGVPPSFEYRPFDEVFARRNVFSNDTEAQFNRLVENPLVQYIKRDGTESDRSVNDWPIFRALILLIILQPVRSLSCIIRADGDKFDQMLARPIAEIDQLVLSYMSLANVIRLNVEPGAQLFLPETGIFSFPIEDPEATIGLSIGFGVPLRPDLSLMLVPNSVKIESLEKLGIWVYSASPLHPPCSVVAPPGAIARFGEARLVEIVVDAQRVRSDHWSLIHQKIELFGKMKATIGLSSGVTCEVRSIRNCFDSAPVLARQTRVMRLRRMAELPRSYASKRHLNNEERINSDSALNHITSHKSPQAPHDVLNIESLQNSPYQRHIPQLELRSDHRLEDLCHLPELRRLPEMNLLTEHICLGVCTRSQPCSRDTSALLD